MPDEHARQKEPGRRKTRIMLDESRGTLAVSFDEALHDTEPRTFGIFVFTVTSARTIRDNPFDIPFIRVEKKTNQRLFVVRIAARISLNHDAQAISGERLANNQNKHEER